MYIKKLYFVNLFKISLRSVLKLQVKFHTFNMLTHCYCIPIFSRDIGLTHLVLNMYVLACVRIRVCGGVHVNEKANCCSFLGLIEYIMTEYSHFIKKLYKLTL